MSANTKLVLAGMTTKGDTFHPCPSSRAACHAEPLVVAMAARPFSPVKFSGLMERERALDNVSNPARVPNSTAGRAYEIRRSASNVVSVGRTKGSFMMQDWNDGRS